jgi:hypothetical protein
MHMCFINIVTTCDAFRFEMWHSLTSHE